MLHLKMHNAFWLRFSVKAKKLNHIKMISKKQNLRKMVK